MNNLPTLTPMDISKEQNAYTKYADVRGEIDDKQKRSWKMVTEWAILCYGSSEISGMRLGPGCPRFGTNDRGCASTT